MYLKKKKKASKHNNNCNNHLHKIINNRETFNRYKEIKLSLIIQINNNKYTLYFAYFSLTPCSPSPHIRTHTHTQIIIIISFLKIILGIKVRTLRLKFIIRISKCRENTREKINSILAI